MSDFIIDVTEADFQYEVLQYSRQKPVIVDFWAEWCQPCKVLGPMLHRLIEEQNGRLRLAKVDVDANPNLALRYNVRSIPIVKGFINGDVVSEFVGLIPEQKMRDFFKALAPSSSDLATEKANSLLLNHQWNLAESTFRKVIAGAPSSTALLGLAKSLLAQNKAQEAKDILRNFPASRDYSAAEKLMPLAVALLEHPGLEDTNPLEATFQRALLLVRKGNIPAALDGFIEVLRQNKTFREGEVRKIMVAIFEILGEHSDLTRQYRQEMASILF